MTFVSLWYEIEPKQGVQLVYYSFGSLYRTVLVISVTAASPSSAQVNISFIFVSSSFLNWAKIASSFVIMVWAISWVSFTYWINLLHHSFASCIVFFSNMGKVIFWCCFVLPFLCDSSLEEFRPVRSFVMILELFEIIVTGPCCIL